MSLGEFIFLFAEHPVLLYHLKPRLGRANEPELTKCRSLPGQPLDMLALKVH